MTASRRLGWWLYALLTLAIGYGHLIRKILTDAGGPGSRLGPPAAATILAVGVLAAVRQTPFLRAGVWKAVFWILVAASIASVALGALLLLQGVTSLSVAILFLVPAFLVPGETQLFRYAFKRPEVWARQA